MFLFYCENLTKTIDIYIDLIYNYMRSIIKLKQFNIKSGVDQMPT